MHPFYTLTRIVRARSTCYLGALLLLATSFSAQAQTGGVGIGTTAPDASAALDIVSSSKGVLLPRVADATALASPAPGLLVYQTGSPAGFYYNSGTAAAPSWQQIGTTTKGDNLGNHTATQNLNLGTNQLTGNGGTSGLTISNTGNVGIGVSGLANRLAVVGSGSTAQLLVRNPTGGTGATAAFDFQTYPPSAATDPSGASIRASDDGAASASLLFLTKQPGASANALVERLRIASGGNVGVGTTTPVSRLSIGQVTSQSSTASQNLGELSFVGFNRPNSSASIQALSKDYDDTGHLLFKTSPGGTGATERMRITADGNVGIGTTSPTEALDVNGGILARGSGLISNQGAHLQWNRSGGLGETWLLNQQGLGSGGIFFGASNSVSSGSNTVTEWARFDSNGDLGLGTRADPAASALFELASTTKGLLPPRLSQTQRDAIGSPATALTLYNTTTNKLNTWNGSSWDAALSATEPAVSNASQTYTTPGQYSYTVPVGVHSISVDAAGAQGGNGGYPGSHSAQGARVQATLAVTPGEVLAVFVGGAGTNRFNGTGGGYNGGGNGSGGAGGGGASDIRRGGTALTGRVLVAAGGGGSGEENPLGGVSSVGGDGGAPNGGNGNVEYPGASNVAAGTGATQSAGGNAGGTLGQGGNAPALNSSGGANTSGGGGGGYYGGGGGLSYSGGGGGSSFVGGAAANVQMTAGANGGNGRITITPSLAYAAPSLDGSNFTSVASVNGLLARGSDIVAEQGAHLQWNRSGYQGETWLLNQNGSGPGGIRFGQSDQSNNVTEWGRFDPNGRLGIGTTSPIAPLHIKGAVSTGFGGGGISFFNACGSGFANCNGQGASNKSVVAYFESGEVWVNGYVVAGALQTTSDRRIKHVIGLSNATTDLALLNRLRITDYTYIDQVNNAPGVIKKVLAQEVEEVLPTAVSRSRQALPNVYEQATAISYAAGYLTVTTAKPHELPATGGRMRFYTPTNESLDPEVTVVNAHTVRFASADSYAAGLFVYGKYVDDFRSVDYDALTTLNVSATQELARKVAALEVANAALQIRVATAEAKAATATATLDTFEARLRRLEAGSAQAQR